MLPKYLKVDVPDPVDLNTSIFWRDWTDQFLAAKTQRMNDQISEIFIKLSMVEMMPETPAVTEANENMSKKFIGTLQGRALSEVGRSIGLRMTLGACLLIGALSKDPASIVMYAHALRRMQMVKNVEVVSLGTIAEHAFPAGFLTDAELSRMWELQKDSDAPLGNFLDGVYDAQHYDLAERA